jgi:hypothetical protein
MWPESYLPTEPIIVFRLIMGGKATAKKEGLKVGNRILDRVTSYEKEKNNGKNQKVFQG